jgi:hypothetical protein
VQISESHCGPAVIQMMLSNLDIAVTQEAVAEAGGAKDLIELNGMRIDQLGMAVHVLAPEVRFYYKEHATIAELVHIVNDYRFPVGVEWQGLFEDEDEDEDEAEDDDDDEEDGSDDSETEDDDYGHYSLVTHADRRRKLLIIADPYKDYIDQARLFHFDEFNARWWDTNEVIDPQTGEPFYKLDDHMMFVVVPKTVRFPLRMGMTRFIP